MKVHWINRVEECFEKDLRCLHYKECWLKTMPDEADCRGLKPTPRAISYGISAIKYPETNYTGESRGQSKEF